MIISMNFSLVPSNELLTFGNRLFSIFDGKNLEGTSLDFFLKVLKKTLDDFTRSFQHKATEPYTELTAMADALRDQAFYAFRFYVDACTHSDSPGWRDAAMKIKNVIRKHGWKAPNLGYKAETAALKNISSEIHGQYAAELNLISGTNWLTRMETTQKSFEDVTANNLAELATGNPTLVETRPLLTNAIRSLLQSLNLQNEMASTPELVSFINQINSLIVTTMSTVKANVSRQENEPGAPASGTTAKP